MTTKTDNLQLLCRSCNTKKGTKSLITFMAEMNPDLFNEKSDGAAYFALAGESAAKERT